MRALVVIIVLGGLAAGIAGWWVLSSRGTDASEAVSPPVAETTTTVSLPTTGSTPPTTATTQPPIAAPTVLRTEHAPLVNIDGWLQSDVESLEELRGQVVLVEFWTFGCYNCRNRLPYTKDIYAKYRDQGLEIVAIHSPEFAYEAEVENITQALADLEIPWPIVLDTDRSTFREWQGRRAYWPRTYLLDRQGQVRYDHIGEGGYEELDATVAFLLTEEL